MAHHVGHGVASEFSKHLGAIWEKELKSHFAGTDYVVGNLEAPLSNDLNRYSDFEGSAQFARFLQNVGVNYLSVANNHILEKGEEGFRDTIAILKGASIKPLGFNHEGEPIIELLSKDGVTIAIAAFNAIHDFKNDGLYCELKTESVRNVLSRMTEADFKVLVLHWGHEYISIPSYDQIELAKELIDHGADVIIGHHPHVVQPIMKYGKGVIFFSLGNFIFDMIYRRNVRIGLSVSIDFGENKRIDYTLKPYYIDDNFCPRLDTVNNNLVNRHLSKVISNFRKLYLLDKKDYQRRFLLYLKITNFWQRLIMKKDLCQSLFKMDNNGRRIFFNRLKKRLIEQNQ